MQQAIRKQKIIKTNHQESSENHHDDFWCF
jgi:hypothetical protein